MSRTEANPTPSVLVWAREAAGLSREIAARKIGVSEDRLAVWESESGEQRPTFAQLRKLGAVYRRPLAIFYLAGPPKGFAPMHDFRRAAGSTGLPNSPELTLEIRRAHDRREWAIELFAQIEERPRDLSGSLTLSQSPETAATEVRRLLSVTLREQTTWRDEYEALRRWRLLLERAGILTFQANDVETTEARGFSISERPLPVAVTNIKDSPRGRIFTLLHEAVHILLGDGGICDLHESDESRRSRTEAFCNRVAGATLFPRDALLATNTVQSHKRGDIAWTDEELKEVSRHFGGSREAALVRLITLGLTTQAYYEEKHEGFLKLYAQQRARLKGGFAPPHEVALTSAGPTFTRLVIESFNRERITASDVSDYLQVRLKHLNDIQGDYAEVAL